MTTILTKNQAIELAVKRTIDKKKSYKIAHIPSQNRWSVVPESIWNNGLTTDEFDQMVLVAEASYDKQSNNAVIFDLESDSFLDIN